MADESEVVVQLTPVGEGESGDITGLLVKADGTPIPTGTPGLTLKVTAYDEASGQVLNSRLNQNILNTNQGTLDVNGNFKLALGAADTVLISRAHRLERHVYQFTWTWTESGTTRVGHQDFIFPVLQRRVIS